MEQLKTNKVTVQEILTDIGAILNKINFALNDHEQRLLLIEEVDLKIELEVLARRITALSDRQKKKDALEKFKALCDTLGISDLELIDS